MRITDSHFGFIAKKTVSGMEIMESVMVPKFTVLEPGEKGLVLLKNGKKVKAVGRFWLSEQFGNGQYMVVDWKY